MKITALIIDDMPLAIASLQADLADNHADDIEVIGTASGVMEGAKLIKRLKPDMIFLDIHMGDGDGFDLLDIISEGTVKVVFTTASKEHAIQAFQFEAVDYLLKPVDPELLDAAIHKVKILHQSSPNMNAALSAKPQTIALNTQEEIRILNLVDVIRLEAMGNYTTFYTSDEKILVTKTLKEFEKVLADDFIRVHQSHLVNRLHIKSYIKTEGGYLKMKDGSDVPVSVRKKSYVIDLLK